MATLNYNNVSMEIPIPSNYTNNTGYISQLPYTASTIENNREAFMRDYSGKLMSAIEINWGNAHSDESSINNKFNSYINSSLDIVNNINISYNVASDAQNIANISYNTSNDNKNEIDLIKQTNYEYQYFTIESLEDDNKIYWSSPIIGDIDYIFTSKKADVWLQKNVSNQIPITILNKGDKLFIRRIYDNNHDANRQYNSHFSSSKNFIVYGNIMSLFYGKDFIGKYDFLQKRQNVSIVNPNSEHSESLYNIFSYLFASCTTLINAENLILPATILQYGCYARMFAGCKNLEKAPKLPATTLAQLCYEAMFLNCALLIKAPELPATTLAQSCYTNMFSDCTSLTKAPELPATTLTDNCYAGMFGGCKSLIKSPELPATTLAQRCYAGMFYGCKSLTKAPELPATTLVDSCYESMFESCELLNYVKILAENNENNNNNNSSQLNNWLKDVAKNGTLVKNELLYLEIDSDSGIPETWNVGTINYNNSSDNKLKCFTIESLEDDNTITINCTCTELYRNKKINLKYSFDGINWYVLTFDLNDIFTDNDYNKTLKELTLNKYQQIMFINETDSYYNYDNGDKFSINIISNKKINISGNIMSLLSGDNFINDTDLITNSSKFSYLFKGCSYLVNAENLILPNTTLPEECYANMFKDCTSLTRAPELSGILNSNQSKNCYKEMFSGCTSLKYIKMQVSDNAITNNTTWENYCHDMAYNVANKGIFVKNESLSYIKRGDHGIKNNWYIYDDDSFDLIGLGILIGDLTYSLTHLLHATEIVGESNEVALGYLRSVHDRIDDMQLVQQIEITNRPVPVLDPAPGFDGGNSNNGN